MAVRSGSNRLYDTHTGGKVIALKADLLFTKALQRLMEEGYVNVAEALYECVYEKMNSLGEDSYYPTLAGWQKKRNKEEEEMERALQGLSAVKANLGVMKAR